MASKRWVGRALPTKRHERLTVSGSWATGNTITVTINTRALVVTVGTNVAIDDIVALLAAAINGEPVIGDETRNVDNIQETGEFSEIEAVAEAANDRVNVYARTAGKPFTLTISETAAGSIAQSTVVAGTGPNYASDINNWLHANGTPSLPVDSDDLIIDESDIDILYDLDALTSVTPLSLRISRNYTGMIGLPDINRDTPGKEYTEYRPTFFSLGQASDAINTAIEIGRGIGQGSQRLKLDFGDSRFSAIVYSTGVAAADGIHAVEIKGTNTANTLHVISGDVGVAVGRLDSAHLQTLTVGSTGDALPATVETGSGVDLINAAVVVNNGTLTISSSTSSGTVKVYGGILNLLAGIHAGVLVVHADVDVFGGSVHPMGFGTITSLAIVSGGIVDFDAGSGAWTVTTAFLYDGAGLYNSFKLATFTNPITYVGDLRKMDLRLGFSGTITVAP